jgi:hypothetical protein
MAGFRCELCGGLMRVRRTTSTESRIARLRVCRSAGCPARLMTVEVPEGATGAPEADFRARCTEALVFLAEKVRRGDYG